MISRPLLLATGLALMASVGCSAAPDEEAEFDEPSEDALEEARTAVADGLPVFTSESPTGGTTFNFCTKPSAPINLTNAAWLSMLSANEYAHLGYYAPQLLDLGFGTARDRVWVQCGKDLGKLRDYELTHEEELARLANSGPAYLLTHFRDARRVGQFGTCAQDFLEKRYTAQGADGAELPGSALRDFLMRETQEASYIQFLSGKPYSFLEKWMGRGSAQAVVARHGTKPVIVVAFRGTEPPQKDNIRFRQVIDLIKDLEFFKTDLTAKGFSQGWGFAHSGFLSSFQALDDVDAGRALTRRIKALTAQDPNVGIWITGHSLGGALATLMTARLLDQMDQGEKLNVKGMYTFGSPMVGNDVFKKKLEESARRHGVSLARFRNDQDLVTRVPGVFDIMNYHHVGELAWLTPSGLSTPTTDPPYADSNMLDHSIAGLAGPRGSRREVSGYYSRIAAAMKAKPEMSRCDAP